MYIFKISQELFDQFKFCKKVLKLLFSVDTNFKVDLKILGFVHMTGKINLESNNIFEWDIWA